MRRAAFLLALLTLAGAAQAQLLVDIVNDVTDPLNRPDTEPSIAVNPLNANEISVIAFPSAWDAETMAPVFKSRDGGLTWTPVRQIPQPAAASTRSQDQQITYTADGKLLIVEIASNLAKPRCFFYRQTAGPDDPLTRGAPYGDDQPQVASDNTLTSPFFNRRYSPWLDLIVGNFRSTVARTTDGGVTIANVPVGDNSAFSNRTTRIAVAPDGGVYILYKTVEDSVDFDFNHSHFFVKRSDDGGATWPAGPGVSVHGPAAVTSWFTPVWGNPARGKTGRARSSDGWIAINPANGNVWVVYCHRDASGFGQIFVVRSTDRGVTWSTPSRVTDGTHHSAFPEIAVTRSGAVGVLYVDYDDSLPNISFRHRFAQSADNGATWSDVVLQAMDPTGIANAEDSFLWGDYEGLTAAGHTFYGVFTGASIGRVPVQFDPIFFRISATPPDKDFYVRDWTDSATSGDNGAEPSTHPLFYATSDVWNLRTNTTPAFNADNQPVHETPNNGGAAPNNFMFARVFRNSAGAAQNVQARFMFSEFGTGSNYRSAGSETIAFGAGETSMVSGARPWTLPSTASNHVCLLVEVSTPDDPIQPPSLLNHAPGWPTSDLNVLNDNNKAQRNTSVHHEPSVVSTSAETYAIIHNAGFDPHDFVLDYAVDGGEVVIRSVSGNERSSGKAGTIRISGLLPGENRWVGLQLSHAPGAAASVDVSQMELGHPVNGFRVRIEPAPMSVLIGENLDDRMTFFRRLGETAYADRIAEAMKGKLTEDDYAALVAEGSAVIGGLKPELRDALESAPFDFAGALKALETALGAGKADEIAIADAAFLQRADAAMTKVQKDGGDDADIEQMTQWEQSLGLGCGGGLTYADAVHALADCAAKRGIAVPPFTTTEPRELERIHREILLKLAGY